VAEPGAAAAREAGRRRSRGVGEAVRSALRLVLPMGLAFAGLPARGQPPAAEAPKIVKECPDAPTGDLVVCGRSDARSPYRLPPQADGWTPDGAMESVSRERHRLLDAGASGIGSCSTAGPGGWTGCDLIRWKEGYEQRAGFKRNEPRAFITVGPLKRPGAGN